jgi:glycosyltransferase involved in cell wall biosynthesis
VRFHWYWPFVREDELAMARAVASGGHEVLVEVIDRDAAPAERGGESVTVVRDLPDVTRAARMTWLPSRGATYVRRATARRRSWDSAAFDLYHLHYINRFTDAVSRLPRPLVMSVHDVVPHVPRLSNRLEHGILRRVYHRPDAIVVHHPRVGDELLARFGVAPERVHVVPYPVLARSVASEPPTDGPPIVLLFGALRANKGLEVLDGAAGELWGVDVRFVVAGRGHAHLEAQAKAMQSRDGRVRAEIGFVSQARKDELFRAASIVVLPYTSFSSQSAVLHDAYGYGRPVVVTDVGALGDTVRADGTGVVVAANDHLALARGIASLLDPKSWLDASDRCHAVAASRTPEVFGVSLRAVYAELT